MISDAQQQINETEAPECCNPHGYFLIKSNFHTNLLGNSGKQQA